MSNNNKPIRVKLIANPGVLRVISPEPGAGAEKPLEKAR